MRKLAQLLLVCAAVFSLSGCGQINLQIDVDPQTHKFNIVQTVVLQAETQELLAILQKPGTDDFWERLSSLCKDNNWRFKEQSVNQLSIKAPFAADQVNAGTTLVSKELAWLAKAYGAKPPEHFEELLPVNLSIVKHDDLFQSTYQANCDYDLSLAALEKKLQAPDQWRGHIVEANGMPITVKVIVPMEVVNTNGTYDAGSHRCTWTVHLGEKGRAFVTYRALNPISLAIAGGIGMVAFVVLLAFLFFKAKKKNRPVDQTANSKSQD